MAWICQGNCPQIWRKKFSRKTTEKELKFCQEIFYSQDSNRLAYFHIIQDSFDSILVAKRRKRKEFWAISLGVFKSFRERVASLVKLYIYKEKICIIQLAHKPAQHTRAVLPRIHTYVSIIKPNKTETKHVNDNKFSIDLFLNYSVVSLWRHLQIHFHIFSNIVNAKAIHKMSAGACKN